MPVAGRIEIVEAKALTSSDEVLWRRFIAARPDLTGPYFDIRYVQTIAASVPNSGVARLYDGERVVAYFAFQKRGDALLPMGAPLSDYHAVICEPGVEIDFNRLLRATGTKRLEFQGWVGDMPGRASALTRRVADATLGFDHWWATQDATNHKFFKNISRCLRNVDKDFGGFDFTWERVTPELMDWVIHLKREQYKKSGMHDVFGCRWTRGLLDGLAAVDDADFGLRAGVLRHQGRLVAVEIGLVQGEEVHLWFPAYDPEYYRYSVGILLTVAIIKNTEALGLKRFDFGTGGEEYKSPMTIAAGTCVEGDLVLSPALISRMADLGARVFPPEPYQAARLSVKRRVKVIRATETTVVGWGRAFAALARRAVMRLGISRVYGRLARQSVAVSPVVFLG